MTQDFEHVPSLPINGGGELEKPEKGKEEYPQVPENVRRKVDFLKRVEEKGIDFQTEDGVNQVGTGIVRGMNKLFQERYSLDVVEPLLPAVQIKEDANESSLEASTNTTNQQVSGVINMRSRRDVLSGDVVSEELAHFYRIFYTPKESTEEITHEFFGFLGRRLWQKAAKEGVGDLDFLIDNDPAFPSKRAVLNESKVLKAKSVESSEESNKQDLIDERRSVLVHQRGYEYASKVDLAKIHNWTKVFCLPNKEIRKRFFTDKPDYSDL
jgi:hypothetical protein